MKHYTDKETLCVFGYKSIKDDQVFNDDFENLIEMTDELFQEYRAQKPGHKWSLNGWVEDNALMQELREREKQSKILKIESRIEKLKQDLIVANIRGKETVEILAEIDLLEIEIRV